jgi:hypothetical protein
MLYLNCILELRLWNLDLAEHKTVTHIAEQGVDAVCALMNCDGRTQLRNDLILRSALKPKNSRSLVISHSVWIIFS